MKLIETHMQAIRALCKKYKVRRLFVFGSIRTDRFTDASDVDMIVDFDKAEVLDYFDNYFDLSGFGRGTDHKKSLFEEECGRNKIIDIWMNW